MFFSCVLQSPRRDVVPGHIRSNADAKLSQVVSFLASQCRLTHQVRNLPDMASRRLQHIAREGLVSDTQMLEAVRLLSEISWSTTVTEQGHAALATVHRVHKRYSLENLVKHAFLRQIRPLFTQNADELALLEKEVRRLHKKMPQRLNGQSLFLRHAICPCADSVERDAEGKRCGKPLPDGG